MNKQKENSQVGKSHILSSRQERKLYMSDMRPLAANQNKTINLIQCSIVDNNGNSNFARGRTRCYNEIVDAINRYNGALNWNNLYRVDKALDKSKFLTPREFYQKCKIESQMPSERQQRCTSNINFGDVLTEADRIVVCAKNRITDNAFFNIYFNPTERGDNPVRQTHRNKVNRVYDNIRSCTDAAPENTPSHESDYTKRCSLYAYVYPGAICSHKIHLAPGYFKPSISLKSKAGVIVHELSHFLNVGSTHDYAYGHHCYELSGRKAISNADNYSLAAEAAG